jgi:hypothetical protein
MKYIRWRDFVRSAVLATVVRFATAVRMVNPLSKQLLLVERRLCI